jgi:hypothetical protein
MTKDHNYEDSSSILYIQDEDGSWPSVAEILPITAPELQSEPPPDNDAIPKRDTPDHT